MRELDFEKLRNDPDTFVTIALLVDECIERGKQVELLQHIRGVQADRVRELKLALRCALSYLEAYQGREAQHTIDQIKSALDWESKPAPEGFYNYG